jgi:protein associated with RNAse G/E
MIGSVPDHADRQESAGLPLFPVGSTVVRRDALEGRIWSAAPYRVLADSGAELVLGCWPGLEMLAATTWIEWLRTGNESVRRQAVPNLAARRWELERWAWRDTSVRCWFADRLYWSVHEFAGREHDATFWYVNFELPWRRTSIGFDSFDLFLDLVVDRDSLACRWKDEDEYEHARRLGVVSDAVHAEVDEARQAVVELARARRGPFAQNSTDWRPDPGWAPPVLPPQALTVPARY